MVLNLVSLVGFCVIMAVLGGQCLAAVSADGSLSAAVGIVIIALLSLVISFCGFNVLHIYERFACVPALVAITVATGTCASGLRQQAAAPPATAQAVLSFGMTVAAYMMPWACLASDFTTYFDPETPSRTIFVYAYLGSAVPTILLMTLGAAIQGAVAANAAWADAYAANQVGGVLGAMLAPAGGLGRLLLAVLAFTLLGNMASTWYSAALNLQMLVPARARVPRAVFAVVLTAAVVPVALRAAADFLASLADFVALLAYWSSAFLGVVLAEHRVFRGADCAAYDPAAWDDPGRLPPGVAALAAAAGCMALVVPSIAQVWYTGPIAARTGDLGFEVAFVLAALLYVPFRHVEKRVAGR